LLEICGFNDGLETLTIWPMSFTEKRPTRSEMRGRRMVVE
jgi:hypothetical protein